MSQRKRKNNSNKNKKASTQATSSHKTNHEDFLHAHAKSKAISPENILSLQRTLGNQYVLRQIEQQADSNSIQRGIASDLVFGGANDRNDGADMGDLSTSWAVRSHEHVMIDSTDNVKLKGHWIESAVDDGDAVGKTVLFLSGSGGSAETYGEEIAGMYARRGANVLLANYRGFGDSKKEVIDKHGQTKQKDAKPTQQGLYDDALAMFNWLGTAKGIAEGNVIVHGYSLGGAIAANLMAELAEQGVTPAALVMHSAMPSTKEPAKDAAEDSLGILPKKWARGLGKKIAKMSKTDFTTDDKFQRLAAVHPDFPTLFISGSFADGDHLSDAHTGLSGRAQAEGLTNVTNVDADGGHFDNAGHIRDKAEDFNAFLQSLTDQQIQEADAIIDTM